MQKKPLMRTQSADTTPDAERVQIALLRGAPFVQHIKIVIDLSKMVLQLSRRGLKRLHPHASILDIQLLSLALNHGQRIADEVKEYLQGRDVMFIPPTIMAGMAPVIELLDDLHVPYYVGGSVASSLYGIPRATLDVDIVADLRPEQVHRFAQRLQDAYYVSEDAIRDARRYRSSFNLIHLATMIKVDIFVKKVRPFDQEVFRRLRTVALDTTTPDSNVSSDSDAEIMPAFVWAAPEDIILAKLEWYTMGGGISDRQWNDILGIMKVQAGALDLAYLRHWAAQLSVAEALERALSDAGLDDAQAASNPQDTPDNGTPPATS